MKPNTNPRQDMEIAISWRTQRSLHHVQHCPDHQDLVSRCVEAEAAGPREDLLICTVWN